MTPEQTKARRSSLVLVVCVALAGFLFSACRKGGDTIATLGRVTGAAERDRRASVGSWQKAEEGATFVFGDGVRTAESSRAVVILFDKSTLSLDPKTLVRFLDRRSGPKGAKLDVEMGEATLEAADEAVDVGLELGSARIEAHGKIRLVNNGASTRLEVVIGTARLLSEKESLELHVGDAVDIKPDKGIEKVAAASASAAPSSAPPAPSASAAASAAPDENEPLEIEASGSRSGGPGVVDVLAGAGDSFVVHDPKPPTAIGFSASACPGGAVLTLNSGRTSRETVGKGRVSAEFPAGSHRYVVSCLEANGAKGTRVAEGSISVSPDAGLRKLARTAPLSSVNTDGRRYTVLYQTLLPKLSVRWPNAPSAAAYTLSVQSSRGTRTFSSKAPSYLFGSGVLAEGEHALVFEGGGKRSKPTSIVIRFDNAAPTASLSSPADGSFGPGASVLVAGSALPGWSVTAGGRELAQDEQNRFSGEVAAPSAERALVIRFSQPGRGVHYYLRRSVR